MIYMLVFVTGFWPVSGATTCGDYNGRELSVNSVGMGMDEQVHGISGSWEVGCAICGETLEEEGKLCPGWYCEKAEPNYGIWLKRDNWRACPTTTEAPPPECVSVKVDDCTYDSAPIKDTAESTQKSFHYHAENCNGVINNELTSSQVYTTTTAEEQSFKLTNTIQESFQQKLGYTLNTEAAVNIKSIFTMTVGQSFSSETTLSEVMTSAEEEFKKTVDTDVHEIKEDAKVFVPPAYNTTFTTMATRVQYSSAFTCWATCLDADGEKVGDRISITGTAATHTFEDSQIKFEQTYCGPCMSDGNACLRDECNHQCESATCGTDSPDDQTGWYCFTGHGDIGDLCRCGHEDSVWAWFEQRYIIIVTIAAAALLLAGPFSKAAHSMCGICTCLFGPAKKSVEDGEKSLEEGHATTTGKQWTSEDKQDSVQMVKKQTKPKRVPPPPPPPKKEFPLTTVV